MQEEIGSLIFPFMLHDGMYANVIPASYEDYCISIDYGVINPFSMGLWGRAGGTWYRIKEVYYDARKHGCVLTDKEYFELLYAFAEPRRISAVIIESAAASFIEVVRRHSQFPVVLADTTLNMQRVSLALKYRKIIIHEDCKASRYEFEHYSYGADGKPLRKSDHAMDEIRYFINYIINREIIKFLNVPRTFEGRNL